MNNEVYTIDLNLKRRMGLYGGGDDKCKAIDLETGDILAIVEDFKDSIIFCKFIDDERFIIASLDGTISLMTLEGEVESRTIDEDITKMTISEDSVVIGTANGNVSLL